MFKVTLALSIGVFALAGQARADYRDGTIDVNVDQGTVTAVQPDIALRGATVLDFQMGASYQEVMATLKGNADYKTYDVREGKGNYTDKLRHKDKDYTIHFSQFSSYIAADKRDSTSKDSIEFYFSSNATGNRLLAVYRKLEYLGNNGFPIADAQREFTNRYGRPQVSKDSDGDASWYFNPSGQLLAQPENCSGIDTNHGASIVTQSDLAWNGQAVRKYVLGGCAGFIRVSTPSSNMDAKTSQWLELTAADLSLWRSDRIALSKAAEPFLEEDAAAKAAVTPVKPKF
ncbi:hypothetical protein [Rhizobium leguminosarum]|uniref:hypothetical protein n=1 Tax=Rhizobium leguminosarum TaxID=384 RepID=UPI00155856FB|nr:hypothetical protein [Rhizobium leguminosarum]